MNKYNIYFFYMHLFSMQSQCFKSVIQSGRSLFLSKIKNTSLKLPEGVSPLQLVNSHRNRRYFVIKLHTWFCLSYFLKTNIKCYFIYQYFMSINSFFNTVSVSRYSRPISDPWPRLARSTSFFIIMLLYFFNASYIKKRSVKLRIFQFFIQSASSFSWHAPHYSYFY
jgi:hypothetical protein